MVARSLNHSFGENAERNRETSSPALRVRTDWQETPGAQTLLPSGAGATRGANVSVQNSGPACLFITSHDHSNSAEAQRNHG